MNNIRAKFEEIWPVPDHIEWDGQLGRYEPTMYNWQTIPACDFYNVRLDTFTRRQETMGPVMSLVDEMIADIRYRAYHDADDEDDEKSKALLHRAKQILGDKE